MASLKLFNIMAAMAIFSQITSSQSQVIVSGICPCDVEVVPNFDVSKYLGTWYEYAKYPVFFEGDGVCVTAEYSLQADGNVAVKNSEINQTTAEAEVINGSASIVSNGKLKVVFPVSPAFSVESNYWILDTDYTSYSVVYSCQPSADNQHSTFAWILTRERLPSLATTDTARAVLAKNNISLEPLILTKQDCCN